MSIRGKKNYLWINTARRRRKIAEDVRINPAKYSLPDAAVSQAEAERTALLWTRQDHDSMKNVLNRHTMHCIVLIEEEFMAGSDEVRRSVERVGDNVQFIMYTPYSGAYEEDVFVDTVDVWYTGSRRDGGQNHIKHRMLKKDGDYPAFLASMQRAVRENDAEAWNRAIEMYTISMRPYVAEALAFG